MMMTMTISVWVSELRKLLLNYFKTKLHFAGDDDDDAEGKSLNY